MLTKGNRGLGGTEIAAGEIQRTLTRIRDGLKWEGERGNPPSLFHHPAHYTRVVIVLASSS